MSGPLQGLRIIEFAAFGPGPFAAMVLADLGADVVRVDRLVPVDRGEDRAHRTELLHRGRRSIAIDIRAEEGRELALDLLADADASIEGLRPGVMERLGLGPEPCLERNPRLVYGRVTGWGREGPLAGAAGHDINYIALSGALEPIGRKGDAPVPPLNLVGDNGGGGMVLALAMLAALWERDRSGEGQVVDAAMVDGAAWLTTQFHGFVASGAWDPRRGHNVCTGAPFYDTYRTADDRYVAVGAQEPKFYRQLVERLGLDPDALPPQYDRASWDAVKRQVAEVIATRTRDEWCEAMEGTDACFAPVLSFEEAPEHPHNAARATFVEHDGVRQPAPGARFSRTPAALGPRPPAPGEHTEQVLGELGVTADRAARLRDAGVIG